jgi:hypothetical protein
MTVRLAGIFGRPFKPRPRASLADINYDLHHDQFSQGQTVKQLKPEREVQKWVAYDLQNRKGRAYTLTRESHVVDEKEPDIRLQSNLSDASMPVEVKVAESWSLPQLEDALTKQLVGSYIRERDKRHGILLLVHQHARPNGWEDGTGRFLAFEEVVERLQGIADAMAAAGGAGAPQAEVAVIDVSDVVVPAATKGR